MINFIYIYRKYICILSKGRGAQLKTGQVHKIRNRKNLKTSRAELPLTTETNAVRRRQEKTCPKKNAKGKSAGRKSG